MNWKLILVGVVVLVLLCGISYYFRNNISSILRQGFQNPTEKPSVKELILYYANWCPHCKPVVPEFKKLAPNGEVVVNGVPVKVSVFEVSENKEKHEAANVTGYPTIKYCDTDGTTSEYRGKRNADAFLDYLKEKVGGEN